jgi:hypothetical protein
MTHGVGNIKKNYEKSLCCLVQHLFFHNLMQCGKEIDHIMHVL